MKLKIMESLVAVLAVAGGCCGYRYYSEVYKPEKQIDNAIEEQLELFERIRPEMQIIPEADNSDTESRTENETLSGTEIPSADEDSDDEITVEPENEPDGNPLSLSEEVNDDTVGWIYIPDTNIDYPILQGEDNDFYLHNGADRQYNYELGCPFLDCKCEGDFSGFNSIVFAHNMEGRAMFADIALYKDESFMQSHSQGFLTLEDGTHIVGFFAFLTVPSSDMIYQTKFCSEQDKADYIDYIFKSANYSQNTDIDGASRLILLSTCTFEYEEARGVLVGEIR